MVNWPIPSCWREIQQFLGLTNFFIKYIQGYANLTRPLTDLSKKNVQFDWTPDCNITFNALKHAFTAAPVLALPDPVKPFELVCDASGFGLGAVLLQQRRRLAYYSRKMVAAERNYVVTEHEHLATVEALRVFRCYLHSSQQLTLVTNNRPNTFLQTQPTLSGRQARWSECLQRFHFSWVHRPGRHNVPLSRNPKFKRLNALLAAATTRGSARKYAAPDTIASLAGQSSSTPDASGSRPVSLLLHLILQLLKLVSKANLQLRQLVANANQASLHLLLVLTLSLFLLHLLSKLLSNLLLSSLTLSTLMLRNCMTVLCFTILLKPMLPTLFSVMSPRLPTSPLLRDFDGRMVALWHLTLLTPRGSSFRLFMTIPWLATWESPR